MAITQTTLASAMTVSDLRISVTSATGFATSASAPQYVKIDNEFMAIDQAYNSAPFNAAGTTIPVYRRGDMGGVVAAHNALSIVETGLYSDLTALQAGAQVPIERPVPFGLMTTYSVSGAITIPAESRTILFDKATGTLAMTLAAPTKDQDGLTLLLTSNSAEAHVLTATSLLADGASGSPHTTATWAAYKGASITLMAEQGLWNVVSANNVTVT